MNKNPEMKERTYIGRRRVPRRNIRRRVGLLIHGKYHINFAIEIGEGGMLIYSDEALEKNNRLVVTFNIPFSLPVVATATVRYIMPPDERHERPRYGVYFEKIDFKTRRKIRNYVASEAEDSQTESSSAV